MSLKQTAFLPSPLPLFWRKINSKRRYHRKLTDEELLDPAPKVGVSFLAFTSPIGVGLTNRSHLRSHQLKESIATDSTSSRKALVHFHFGSPTKTRPSINKPHVVIAVSKVCLSRFQLASGRPCRISQSLRWNVPGPSLTLGMLLQLLRRPTRLGLVERTEQPAASNHCARTRPTDRQWSRFEHCARGALKIARTLVPVAPPHTNPWWSLPPSLSHTHHRRLLDFSKDKAALTMVVRHSNKNQVSREKGELVENETLVS